MHELLVRSRAQCEHFGVRQGIEGFKNARSPTIHEMVIRERDDIDSRTAQRTGKADIHPIRKITLLPSGLLGKGPLQVTQHDGRPAQKRQHAVKRIIRTEFGNRFLGAPAQHDVPHGDDRGWRLQESGKLCL